MLSVVKKPGMQMHLILLNTPVQYHYGKVVITRSWVSFRIDSDGVLDVSATVIYQNELLRRGSGMLHATNSVNFGTFSLLFY